MTVCPKYCPLLYNWGGGGELGFMALTQSYTLVCDPNKFFCVVYLSFETFLPPILVCNHFKSKFSLLHHTGEDICIALVV
jgi:hypothetical protein